MSKTKQDAAKHSVEAYALALAASRIRLAARDFELGGADDLAAKARALAKVADTRRRKLMQKAKRQ